jgi:hypothetical protein
LLCNLQYSSGVIFPATAALLLWHCSAAPECPQAARWFGGYSARWFGNEDDYDKAAADEWATGKEDNCAKY